VAFAAFVFERRRWLKRQPGEFAGAIRVSSGDVDGLSRKWKHGSGRWVRDVLVWTKAPLMVRNELVPVDAALGLIGEHRGASKIWHAIDELDQAVRDIRDTIFDAAGAPRGPDAKGTQG
jgi:hypothetical protein